MYKYIIHQPSDWWNAFILSVILTLCLLLRRRLATRTTIATPEHP